MTQILLGLLLVTLLGGLFLLALLRPHLALLLVFSLVSFFPEFSQTEWNVWTAEDFQSLYNFRPLPSITASVFDYLFAVICAGLTLRLLTRPTASFSTPYTVPFWGFAFTVVIALLRGLLMGTETYYAMREFRELAYFLTLVLLIIVLCDVQFVRRWSQLLVIVATLRGLEGVARYIAGIGKDYYDIKLVYYDIAESQLFVMFFFLLLGWTAGALRSYRRFRWWWVLAVAPAAFSFLWSFRRSAWVGAVAAFVAFRVFLGTPRQRAKFALGVVGAMALTAFLIAYRVDAPPEMQFIVERARSVVDTEVDPSNVFRIDDAKNAALAAVRSPLFGIGLGGRYELVYKPESAATYRFMIHVSRSSHDGYLFLAAKLGIPGLVFYLAIYYLFLRALWRAMKKAAGEAMDPFLEGTVAAIGFSVVAFLVTNVMGPLVDTLRSSIFMAYLLACGTILLREIDGSKVPVGWAARFSGEQVTRRDRYQAQLG